MQNELFNWTYDQIDAENWSVIVVTREVNCFIVWDDNYYEGRAPARVYFGTDDFSRDCALKFAVELLNKKTGEIKARKEANEADTCCVR